MYVWPRKRVFRPTKTGLKVARWHCCCQTAGNAESRVRMNRAEELRKILAEEYGIHSDAELEAALKNVPKIDISAMAGERKGAASSKKLKAS